MYFDRASWHQTWKTLQVARVNNPRKKEQSKAKCLGYYAAAILEAVIMWRGKVETGKYCVQRPLNDHNTESVPIDCAHNLEGSLCFFCGHYGTYLVWNCTLFFFYVFLALLQNSHKFTQCSLVDVISQLNALS